MSPFNHYNQSLISGKEFTLEQPRGLGQAAIILRALQQVAFQGAKSFGVQFQPSFDPFPIPTIALLLTMVSAWILYDIDLVVYSSCPLTGPIRIAALVYWSPGCLKRF
jgi:hypothetical protein